MQNAIDQLVAYGLQIEGEPEMGKVVRVNMQDEKRGKRSGWYILHDFRLSNNDIVVVGAYGDHRIGKTEKIDLKGREFTAEEKADYKQQLDKQRELASAERQKISEQAAVRANTIWLSLEKHNFGKSDYLERKKIKAFGVRFSRGAIVVPVRTIDDSLVGLQFIYADSAKKFLTGTAKRGSFHVIGEIKAVDVVESESPAPSLSVEQPICIAEGYATAASIHMASGWPCLVAFDAGNLMPVAEVIRSKYTTAKILICCDDDSAKQDTGRKKGEAAAKAVNGHFFVPDFSRVTTNELQAEATA